MTKEYIKQDLAHLLETITEQVENIYAHQNKIPQIELDITMNNVRNLYEQLIALNKINSKSEFITQGESSKTFTPAVTIFTQMTDEEKPALPEPMKKILMEETPSPNVKEPEEKEIIEEKIEIMTAHLVEEKTITPQPTEKVIEQPKPLERIEPKINIQEEVVIKAVAQVEKQAPKKFIKTTASLFDASPSLGDQFDDATTIQKKISAAKTGKSVVEKIHQQKIEDLKKAIGINDKFLFINELFEGSLASYNEHIEKINTSTEWNHAQSILDSLIAKYNWDSEKEIVKKFMELAERRFI